MAHRIIVSRILKAKLACAGTFCLGQCVPGECKPDSAAPSARGDRNAELAHPALHRHGRDTHQLAARGSGTKDVLPLKVHVTDVPSDAFSAIEARAPILGIQSDEMA